GMSSVVGLLAPVGRSSPFGRRVIFDRPDTAPFRLQAPIAPGLVEAVGIERIETIGFDAPMRLTVPAGAICLDGEREGTFSEKDEVSVALRDAAFRSVDVSGCMTHAASTGWFVEPAGKLPIIGHQQGGYS